MREIVAPKEADAKSFTWPRFIVCCQTAVILSDGVHPQTATPSGNALAQIYIHEKTPHTHSMHCGYTVAVKSVNGGHQLGFQVAKRALFTQKANGTRQGIGICSSFQTSHVLICKTTRGRLPQMHVAAMRVFHRMK